jgi:hypothetical protein
MSDSRITTTIVFTSELERLVAQTNRMRLEFQNKMNEDFKAYLDEDLNVSIFTLHRTAIINSAHVIKDIDLLCRRPVESLSDICRFTTRLQSILERIKSSTITLKEEVATWLVQCERMLEPIITKQYELNLKEDDIHRRKIQVLYHKVGREVELATVRPDTNLRAVQHEMAVSAASQAQTFGLRPGRDDATGPATMYSVTQYDNELTRKIDAKKTEVSREKIEHDWTPAQESAELEKKLKRILHENNNALAMMKVHIEVSRQIHSNKLQSLKPEKRLAYFILMALISGFAEQIKFQEKLFLWERRCALHARRDRDRRKGLPYSPSAEFGLEILAAMYNDEKLPKNLTYPRRSGASKVSQPSPTDSPIQPVKQEDPQEQQDIDDLLAIPEFRNFMKEQSAAVKSKVFGSKKTIKPTLSAPTVEFFPSDLLGVASQAEGLHSFANNLDTVDIDDVRDMIEATIDCTTPLDIDPVVPTVTDDFNLEQMKHDVIIDIAKAWRKRARKLVNDFCGEDNPYNVVARVISFSEQLEKDANFKPVWIDASDAMYFAPYFDLVKFAKYEIDRSDHQSLVAQYPRLLLFINSLKQAARPLVQMVKSQLSKQNDSALITAGFILGGIGLGLSVMFILLMTNVIAFASMGIFALSMLGVAAGSGVTGFAIKKFIHYIQHVRSENIVTTQLDQIKQIEEKELVETVGKDKSHLSMTGKVLSELRASSSSIGDAPSTVLPALRLAPLPPRGEEIAGFKDAVDDQPSIAGADAEAGLRVSTSSSSSSEEDEKTITRLPRSSSFSRH